MSSSAATPSSLQQTNTLPKESPLKSHFIDFLSRAQVEAALQDLLNNHYSINQFLVRCCELFGAQHACLWRTSNEENDHTTARSSSSDLWSTDTLEAEAMSEEYPFQAYLTFELPKEWTQTHLDPCLKSSKCVVFDAPPVKSLSTTHNRSSNPALSPKIKLFKQKDLVSKKIATALNKARVISTPLLSSAFLAMPLIGRNKQQWLLLLERTYSPTRPHNKAAWSAQEVEFSNDLLFSFSLTIENFKLSQQANEHKSYLQNMLNSMDLAVMVIEQPTGPSGPAIVSLINRGFSEIFNVDSTEIEGESYLELMEKIRPLLPDPEVQLHLLEQLLADPFAENIDELVLNNPPSSSASRNTGPRTLYRYATPACDSTGRIFGRMFFFRDITYDKELERQLLHSQKMDSIGTLAGGIAHDFNNLLTTILGYAELLGRELSDDLPRLEKLRQIEKSATRAAELTGQLLAFSRRHPTVLRVIDLNRLVGETMSMLRSTLPTSIDLISDLQPELQVIEADETQIQQALINLVLNARDALGEHGNITVSTHPGYDSQATLEGTQKSYCILEIEDNGVGIPKDVLHRIFEPFYTTKEVGKGTGLGLAMVYGIIKKHSGFIEVTSALGVGTKFSIYLPATTKVIEENKLLNESNKSSMAGGRYQHDATILIVDDEPALREFCQSALSEICTNVHTASNGIEALEKFEELHSKVDLVLLDLTMPKMSGPECFDRLRELDPNCRILVSSGYGVDFNEHTSLKQYATGFLPKPYDLNLLLNTVDALLIQGKNTAPKKPLVELENT